MNIVRNRYFSALIFLLFSLTLYSINLERPAHPDEFYHLLAARGLLETGEPAIGETGRYWRGLPLTWLVAQSLDLFGDSLTAGRLPSVAMIASLVALLFLFLHREAGARAAWLGAGLFAVSPFAIGIAQFVRFYSVQCLLFFVAAWLVYSMLRRPWRPMRMVPLGILAAALLAAAVYFQPTTLFGMVALALWGSGVLVLPWLMDSDVPAARKRKLIVAVAALALLALVGLWLSGILATLWQDYRTTSLFNLPEANRFWYYHAWYVLFYPTVWTLSGLLAVVALVKAPRVTLFLLTIFVVGFLLNSFAARKSMRYIAYAQPFLFAIWGIGLASLWTMASDAIVRLKGQLASKGFGLLSPPAAGRAAATMLFLAGLFTVLANPAWIRSVTQIADIPVPPELPPTRWDAAAPVLDPWLTQVDAVVTSNELGLLYHYGRADYLLSASKMQEQRAAERRAFVRDHRTNVPIIDDPASLEAIMDCHASGLFIVESSHWLGGARLRDDVREVAELILARMQPLELPRGSHLKAFVWEGAANPDCAVPPDRRPIH
jgi:hypothetical protein